MKENFKNLVHIHFQDILTNIHANFYVFEALMLFCNFSLFIFFPEVIYIFCSLTLFTGKME